MDYIAIVVFLTIITVISIYAVFKLFNFFTFEKTGSRYEYEIVEDNNITYEKVIDLQNTKE